MTSLARLHPNTLDDLSALVRRPGYDRQSLAVGVLHLGLGAFHRAHQAVYTDRAITASGGDWGICGVSLRSDRVWRQLSPQEGLFSVTECSAQGRSVEILGALREVLVAPREPLRVLERLADPQVRVVTLTITEKGYCLKPSSGLLDLEHPGIAADLSVDALPQTAIGLLVRGLAMRRAGGAGGVTIMSCDNLSGNGRKLGAAVTTFAESVSEALRDWIVGHCTFPCTMVDRIVPATRPDDLAAAAQALGLEDRAAVMTESFSQWVVENKFAGPVPDWCAAGAELVADVAPFEEMKLRLLNASHSAIAYLGLLAGRETVAEAIESPVLCELIRRLMRDEMAPTLAGLEHFDLSAYQDDLLARFANPELQHATRQIAMDGSQKIPQRLLPAIIARRAQGQQAPLSLLVLAAWARYLLGENEQGLRYEIQDPLAQTFAQLRSESGGNPRGWIESLLRVDAVFPPPLAADKAFADALCRVYTGLLEKGSMAMLAEELA
ncbi:MAG: mannitol dehydrogenase family protein [Pseudomonadota bacterium]